MVDDKSKVTKGNEELTSQDWLPGLYTAVSCKAMVSISDVLHGIQCLRPPNPLQGDLLCQSKIQ